MPYPPSPQPQQSGPSPAPSGGYGPPPAGGQGHPFPPAPLQPPPAGFHRRHQHSYGYGYYASGVPRSGRSKNWPLWVLGALLIATLAGLAWQSCGKNPFTTGTTPPITNSADAGTPPPPPPPPHTYSTLLTDTEWQTYCMTPGVTWMVVQKANPAGGNLPVLAPLCDHDLKSITSAVQDRDGRWHWPCGASLHGGARERTCELVDFGVTSLGEGQNRLFTEAFPGRVAEIWIGSDKRTMPNARLAAVQYGAERATQIPDPALDDLMARCKSTVSKAQPNYNLDSRLSAACMKMEHEKIVYRTIPGAPKPQVLPESQLTILVGSNQEMADHMRAAERAIAQMYRTAADQSAALQQMWAKISAYPTPQDIAGLQRYVATVTQQIINQGPPCPPGQWCGPH